MMTTPAQVLAGLDPDARADLLRRSDRRGLIHLAKHISLIAALMVYVALGLPLWWAALVPLGLALVFLFTLQHECTHQTPFATPWVNDVIGHLCALVLIQPFHWFRAFHMAHHRFTNDPHKDPELKDNAKPETWSALLWHLSTLGYWASKWATLWANARGDFDQSFISPRAHSRLKTESRVLIAAYSMVFVFTLTVSPVLFWIWLVPIVLGFPVLRLYLLAEHGRCPQVANMFDNSRTTLTNRIVRMLAWNMPYHAEHHAFPNVPFHKLPQAHRIAAPHLGEVAQGYSDFSKSYVQSLR